MFPIWITYNCSNLLGVRNLQEQVNKAFCYQKLFWPFTVWINCSSDLKNFANSRPSTSNFKSFSRSLEQFFLTVGQNYFGNKIPLMNPFWESGFFRPKFMLFNPQHSQIGLTKTFEFFFFWLRKCVRTLGRALSLEGVLL